jgi:hypothetical protein
MIQTLEVLAYGVVSFLPLALFFLYGNKLSDRALVILGACYLVFLMVFSLLFGFIQ